MTTDDEPTNEHLRSYINYYNSLNNPKYAVLVKGEWGVGKTHLINSIIKDDQKVYVSLFGLTTIQEVHSAIFVKMYPSRSRIKRILNWFGNSSMKVNDITLALGPLVGNIANAIIKEKVDNSKIIVFDDLERCSINLEDLFGVINKYVEHHECKVIVIAHDDKLNDELTDKKEKIFGQIIKVSPDVEGAFNQFINKSKTPKALGIVKDIIYRSFLASECKSLRVLNYIINDCARLLSCTPEHLLKNKKLLTELFTLFTAVNINYRSGKLNEMDINSRSIIFYHIKKDKSLEDILDEIKCKYKKNDVPLNMESDLLSNEILINTIINGHYDKDEIINSIDNSWHFIKPESKGPWFTIFNFSLFETKKIDDALEELWIKFYNLEMIEKGEILHSVNLLFMLSEIKHINKSIDDVYLFFLEYVKKLQKNNKITPKNLFNDYEPIRGSAYGIPFWVNDSYSHYSAKLDTIFVHHENIALRKKYPSFLAELKTNLKEDTSKFCDQISRDGMPEINKYGYISILSGFKAHEFVDIWLSTEMTTWLNVSVSLVNRYSSGSLKGDLKDEELWLENIKMNIRHRASKASGIDKLRISKLLMSL